MKNYINKFEVNGIEYNNTEIINNTIIGGENKALSAETGKKINEILTDNIVSYTSLNNMTDMLITFPNTGYLPHGTNSISQSSSSWYSDFIEIDHNKIYQVFLYKSIYDRNIGFYKYKNFNSYISSFINDKNQRHVYEFINIPQDANYMVIFTRDNRYSKLLSYDKIRSASYNTELLSNSIKQCIDENIFNKIYTYSRNIFNKYTDCISDKRYYIKQTTGEIFDVQASINSYFIKISKTKINKTYNYKIFSNTTQIDYKCLCFIDGEILPNTSTIKYGNNIISDKDDLNIYLYVTIKPLLSQNTIDNILYNIIDNLVVTESDDTEEINEYIPYYDLYLSLQKEVINNTSFNLYLTDKSNNIIGDKIPITINTSSDNGQTNFDTNTLNYINQIKYKLKENTISEAVVIGNGWSGNLIDGYSHIANTTEPIEFSLSQYTTGTKLLFRFDSDGIVGESSELLISVDDSAKVKTYNGGTHFSIGIYANGGNLKITPSSQFKSSITNLKIQEISDDGTDEITINVGNTYMNNNNMITAFWNVAIGRDQTL